MNAHLRVLHVDDDPTFLKVSKKILMMEGNFEVDTAASVDEAFRKLKTQTYDCIISDYEMPQKNGLEFLKELREQKNEISFVVFTGKGREEVAIKALNLGADGYFTKQGSPPTVYGELSHGIRMATQRKMAEEAIRQNSLKINKIINSISDGVYVLDRGWNFVYVNKTLAKLASSEPEEMIGKNCWHFFPKWVGTVVEREFRDVMTNREIRRFEWKGLYSDDVWEVNVFPSEEGIIVNSRAITEQRKAEEKFRTIFENVHDVVTYVDTKGKMLDVNERVEELLGYKREQIIGKHFTELGLVSFKQLPKLLGLFFSTIRQKEPRKIIELELKHKNGKKVPVEVGTRFIKDKNGKVVAVVNIYRDMTERKAAEQKLRVVGSLTRHDVRNKLTVANNNAYLLKKKLINQPELVKYVENIETAIMQSDKLFEFSRLYEQIGVEKPTEINVAECFNQAASLLNKSELKVVNSCQGLTVVADSMLTKLFYNLIDNSMKHGKTVTEIKLSYLTDQKTVKLFYRDNGVGITNSDKEKIFEGFTTGGSGLGLRLVKKLIEAYGWNIKENGALGKGARFEITIPNAHSSDVGDILVSANFEFDEIKNHFTETCS